MILPVLPNRAYGPFGVLNPFEIWMMVVLIVGISLAAYIAYRLLGARVGVLLGGILGGLISSTATTVSYARETRGQARLAPMSGVVVLVASAVVFARVLFEIWVVSPAVLESTVLPLGAVGVIFATFALVAYGANRGELGELLERETPSDLRAAIVFGLLYAVILLLVSAAKQEFGDTGLYVVAALSGLTDMDALTLSTAQLMKSGEIVEDVGWRVIVVASVSNVCFKAGVVAVLGHAALRRRVLPAFAGLAVSALLIVAFWP